MQESVIDPIKLISFKFTQKNYKIIYKYHYIFGPEHWEALCFNETAIPIISHHLDKLNDLAWLNLCSNKKAIPIISKNLNKIGIAGWWQLAKLPEAISLLEQNFHKLDNNAINNLLTNAAADHLTKNIRAERINKLKRKMDDINYALKKLKR